jgi:hypothetical protein
VRRIEQVCEVISLPRGEKSYGMKKGFLIFALGGLAAVGFHLSRSSEDEVGPKAFGEQKSPTLLGRDIVVAPVFLSGREILAQLPAVLAEVGLPWRSSEPRKICQARWIGISGTQI